MSERCDHMAGGVRCPSVSEYSLVIGGRTRRLCASHRDIERRGIVERARRVDADRAARGDEASGATAETLHGLVDLVLEHGDTHAIARIKQSPVFHRACRAVGVEPPRSRSCECCENL